MFLALIPLLLAAIVVQAVALPGAVPLGIRPDIVLVIVVAWGMLRGWQEGMMVGMIGGLLTDLTAATPWGINIVRLAALGFAAGIVMQRLERQSPLIPVAGAGVATLVGFGVTVLGMQATRWAMPWEYALVYQVLPSAALNMVLMAVAYPVLRALSRRGVAPDEAAAT